MDSESRVYVAGNTGLVGSAIVRKLKEDQCKMQLGKIQVEIKFER